MVVFLLIVDAGVLVVVAGAAAIAIFRLLGAKLV